MGYTHYYEGFNPLSAEEIADVQHIIATAEAAGIKIRDGVGVGEPEIGPKVVINGDASTDDDYETFIIGHAGGDWSFCKTARRPYDAVVGAILIRLKKYQPQAKVDSDGDWDHRDGDGDWVPAQALYHTAFGEVPVNPLSLLSE